MISWLLRWHRARREENQRATALDKTSRDLLAITEREVRYLQDLHRLRVEPTLDRLRRAQTEDPE